MDEAIEISIDSNDGVIDCRLEPLQDDEQPLYFSVTILYPHLVDGFSRSEIYCYNMRQTGNDKTFRFEEDEEYIPQKIKNLEGKLSAAIDKHSR